MSYKLADGSDSSQYKEGDLFEVAQDADGRFKKGDFVQCKSGAKSICPLFERGDGLSHYMYWSKLKLVQEPKSKPFTKDDLKDGMRVIFKNGCERLVFNGGLYYLETTETGERSLHLGANIIDYSDDLTYDADYTNCDIIKVTDRDGTILFQREPELIENTIKATTEQWEKINEILEG